MLWRPWTKWKSESFQHRRFASAGARRLGSLPMYIHGLFTIPAVLILELAAVGSVAATEDATAVPSSLGTSAPRLPEYLGGAPSWVSGPRCGPNCLFVLLMINGLAADIDDVTSRCRISSKTGCSIDDLQRAAGESGLATDVRFVAPSAMPDLRMPFIAHLSPGDERSPSGHFLVVFDYRPSNGDLGVIDGTSGIHSYRNAGILARSLSGYVLVPRDNTGIWLRRAFACELLIVVAAVAWRFAQSMRLGWRVASSPSC
jgi:hypothetical protein